jgi:hypothetical protein
LVEVDGDRRGIETALGAGYKMIAQLSYHDFLYELQGA